MLEQTYLATNGQTGRPITEGRQYPDEWKSPFGEWTSSILLHFDLESQQILVVAVMKQSSEDAKI